MLLMTRSKNTMAVMCGMITRNKYVAILVIMIIMIIVIGLLIIIALQLHCCGVASWKDYSQILGKDEVPQSCCNPAETSITECNLFRVNPDERIADQYFYTTVSIAKQRCRMYTNNSM